MRAGERRSLLRFLCLGLGRSASPGRKEKARLLEHGLGAPRLRTPIEHIANLVANLASGNVRSDRQTRSRATRRSRLGEHRAVEESARLEGRPDEVHPR